MRLWSVCGWVLLTLLPQSAHARPSEADEHYRRGVEHAKNGNLVEARAAFEAAFSSSPHPRVLFSLAKVALRMDRSADAIDYLKRYLEMDLRAVPPEEVEQVRAALRKLEEEARTPEPLPPAPAPDESVPPAEAPRPAEPSEPQPSAAPAPATAASSSPVPLAVPPPLVSGTSPSPRPVFTDQDAPLDGRAAVALTLGGTGAALLLSGLGVWLWNDANYDALVTTHERLQETQPPAVAGPDQLEPLVDYASAAGRNDAEFEAVQRFDVLTWTLVGAGLAAVGTGAWLWFTPQEPVPDRVGFSPRGIRWRW